MSDDLVRLLIFVLLTLWNYNFGSSKRLLAWQLIIQNQADRPQLRWADCVARAFDAACKCSFGFQRFLGRSKFSPVTMAVAIISKPTHDRNGELDEWISLTHNLLRDMSNSNALVPKASQCLDLIQRHVRTVFQPSFDLSGSPTPSIPIVQYLERATQTMAQPQPSMVDVFDAQTIAEPLWGSELAPGYLIQFPSIELCCENVDYTPLQRFINDCSLTYS